MKYIILLLFATLANADIYIQRITNSALGEGYILAFPRDGVIQCIGMPDLIDLSIVPQTWMTVKDAGLAYNWPTMTGNAADACKSLKVPRVTFNTMYGINITGQIVAVGTIPVGTICGERISDISFLRTVTYKGRYGFAICS